VLPRRNRLRQTVSTFDDAVDTRLDEVRGHKLLDRGMYLATELGDFGLIWLIIGTAQALRPGRKEISALRLAAILGAESVLVNGVIKSFFRRKRPLFDQVRPHRMRTPRSSSFPSGHASSAFTAAGVLSQNDPLWPLYYGVAGVVASSRAYVKIHHASDVVAGAALGVVLAKIARKVWPAPT
jgi:undecaprenyl-diphosphatase